MGGARFQETRAAKCYHQRDAALYVRSGATPLAVGPDRRSGDLLHAGTGWDVFLILTTAHSVRRPISKTDELSFPNKTMVATIVSLPERFGTGQGNFRVEPLTISVVGMAEEPVANILSPHLQKRLGPQALSYFQFESLRRVIDDLSG